MRSRGIAEGADRRHDPPTWCPAFTGHRPRRAAAARPPAPTIHPSRMPTPPGGGLSLRVEHGRGRPGAVVPPHHRVLEVETSAPPPGPPATASRRFDRAVRLHAPVAVEMVGRDVRVYRRWCLATVSGQLELRARGRRGARGELRQPLDERRTDVPAEDRGFRPAARIAAIKALVVVLPFVPVTPIVGAGYSRRSRSDSLTSAGGRSRRAGLEGGGAAARRRGSVVR